MSHLLGGYELGLAGFPGWARSIGRAVKIPPATAQPALGGGHSWAFGVKAAGLAAPGIFLDGLASHRHGTTWENVRLIFGKGRLGIWRPLRFRPPEAMRLVLAILFLEEPAVVAGPPLVTNA